MKLAEKLIDPSRRARVIEACLRLIDDEVKSKGGLSGIAVKGAYGVVKAVKPKFVPEVVDGMLDEWVEKLEPFWGTWTAEGGGKSFPDYLTGRKSDVAEALLGVTDGRARQSRNGSVRRMYDKMRPTAKKHVEEAVPRLGRMVEKEMAA
ncbi:MAG TPA: hypothetical protein VKE22_03360 [Haliangiales bacterium]|nr:hypothetical protein [Haliangiales bacterium]